MPFTFEGYAKSIKDPIQKGKFIGVWTDGIGISSDDVPMCAFPLKEGEKYKITIEMIPSEFCGVDNLNIDSQSNPKLKYTNRIFLYLRKEFETPFFKYKKGSSYYSNMWASILGTTHKHFLERYEDDEYFAGWFSQKEIKGDLKNERR